MPLLRTLFMSNMSILGLLTCSFLLATSMLFLGYYHYCHYYQCDFIHCAFIRVIVTMHINGRVSSSETVCCQTIFRLQLKRFFELSNLKFCPFQCKIYCVMYLVACVDDFEISFIARTAYSMLLIQRIVWYFEREGMTNKKHCTRVIHCARSMTVRENICQLTKALLRSVQGMAFPYCSAVDLQKKSEKRSCLERRLKQSGNITTQTVFHITDFWAEKEVWSISCDLKSLLGRTMSALYSHRTRWVYFTWAFTISCSIKL